MHQTLSKILFAKAFESLFRKARYKVYYGGRGAAKSWHFALALIILATQNKIRVLCTRQYQSSISESVHKLLLDSIKRLKLQKFYGVTKEKIKCVNGSEFLFHGLAHEISKIKSIENIDICWIEEAHNVSKTSWDILIPTIRAENSEIWISFNPYLESDETYQRFIAHTLENSIVKKVTYKDNPWFPKVLEEERINCKNNDFESYQNIWEGECLKYSKAQIFQDKYEVRDFIAAENTKFYHGADWGFSQDPTVLIRAFIEGNSLFIDYEAYATNVDIDETVQLFDTIPTARTCAIKADSARPETIRYMQKQGFNIKGASKWQGSILDGISILKSFDKIIIHPRCMHMIDEAKNYSYKVDRNTLEVLPIVEDKHNHCFDALRYALEPYIKGRAPMNFKR